MTRIWTKTDTGILSLEGTDFRVVYTPGQPCGDFSLYQGERLRGGMATLWFAKYEAENYQKEIEEIL